MDFTLNLKAFLQSLPLRDMSGHQKFVAVSAAVAKGDKRTVLTTGEIKANWKKAILGIKYNPVFYDRAQGEGWADPVGGTKGKFKLTQNGLDNIAALVPDMPAGELQKSGQLIVVNRKATHTFDKFLRSVFAAAQTQVLLADSWVDETIFDNVLDLIPKTCVVHLLYANPRGAFDARVKRFSKEYSKFSTKQYKNLHDRFMVVDETAYILGPSIKDAASNSPALVVVLGSKEKQALQNFFNELWKKAK